MFVENFCVISSFSKQICLSNQEVLKDFESKHEMGSIYVALKRVQSAFLSLDLFQLK